jgi:hypothetical protein
MCRTLLNELDRDQPNTTNELFDIATRHASSKEPVKATFVLAMGKWSLAVARQRHPKPLECCNTLIFARK